MKPEDRPEASKLKTDLEEYLYTSMTLKNMARDSRTVWSWQGTILPKGTSYGHHIAFYMYMECLFLITVFMNWCGIIYYNCHDKETTHFISLKAALKWN